MATKAIADKKASTRCILRTSDLQTWFLFVALLRMQAPLYSLKVTISNQALVDLPSDLNPTWKELDCQDNKISSLKGLAQVTALTKLEASNNNPLASLEGIEELRSLTYLDVSHCSLSSLEPISSLASLTDVRIHHNSLSSLAPLSSLRSLSKLTCSTNEVSDLQPLSLLNKLTYLDCGSNWISSLAPLSALTALRVLYFQDNYVTSLQPLLSHPRLQRINFSYLRLVSLAPLASVAAISSLTTVWYSPDQKPIIDALNKQRSLTTRPVKDDPRHRPRRVVAYSPPPKDDDSEFFLGFLASLDLQQYASFFRRDGVDLDIARRMTEVALKQLGLPLPVRKKLLDAFASLPGQEIPPPPPPIPPPRSLHRKK